MSVPQLAALDPGLLIEHLYETVGTSAVLVELEALHRRDAQRTGESIERPGDHTELVRVLRVCREIGAPHETRLRAKAGGAA